MKALLAAGALSFLAGLLGMPLLIRWLAGHGIGQQIRQEGHIPETHRKKKGTPTMGGIAIVGSAVTGYVLAHYIPGGVPFSRGGLLVVFAFVGAGLVGLADDWIKVTRKRSLGLNKRAKIAGQFAVAIVFAVLAVRWAHVGRTIGFTRSGFPGWHVPAAVWVLLCLVVLIGTSNGVNLTDGLDGLAGGCSMYSFIGYTVMAFWMFRNRPTYQVPQALDLAVLSAAIVGACAGFLWWNAAPARIFMGDVGSLAIGSALGAIAMITYTPLLLPLLGMVFVVETLSVMLQVFTFRLMGGRRVLRMAPIHHHFELGGWPETWVVVRFWLLQMAFVSIAIGVFYADFLSVEHR